MPAQPGPRLPPRRTAARSGALQEITCETVNDGVHRAGFAATQDAYDEAVQPLFPSLVRFDPVYVGHCKGNLRRIVDDPHLWPYARDLHQTPGVAETVDFDHIKRRHQMMHRQISPTGIIPAGPFVEVTAVHDRARLG